MKKDQKLIAIFMGFSGFYKVGKDGWRGQLINEQEDHNDWIPDYDNYEEIMPVLEKIESIGFMTLIQKGKDKEQSCTIYGGEISEHSTNRRADIFFKTAKTKPLAIRMACVEFIIFYNKHLKNKKKG